MIRVKDLPRLHRAISILFRTSLLVEHGASLLLFVVGAVLRALRWLRWIHLDSSGLHMRWAGTGYRLL